MPAARRKPTWVVALGGNAMLRADQRGTYAEQMDNVRATAAILARVIGAGRTRVVVTHGNGPQVGSILRQNELAATETPAMPLDACGAMSQGLLGYLLAQALSSALPPGGPPVVGMVTRVSVNANDPVFTQPSKPVGRYYDDDEARELARRGYALRYDRRRGGWRRVVPSPLPREVLEIDALRVLLDEGAVVVACGGGGTPVVRVGRHWVGVEAVVDKDLASARLADAVGAEQLVILTDVQGAAVEFGSERQRFLGRVSARELRALRDQGQFGSGSMGPKVDALLGFVEGGPRRVAAVGALDAAEDVLAGRAGTRVYAASGA